jgi:hypothetical protein
VRSIGPIGSVGSAGPVRRGWKAGKEDKSLVHSSRMQFHLRDID